MDTMKTTTTNTTTTTTTRSCHRCHKQAARPGKTRCVECARLDSTGARANFLRKRAALLAVDPTAGGSRKFRPPCAGCGAARAAGRYRCAVHLSEEIVLMKARRSRYREQHRCYYCVSPARAGRTTCDFHASGAVDRRRRSGGV
jgi:hypothetical protein